MNKTLLALSVFTLGAAVTVLPVSADNSMPGMDMGGKPAAQKPVASSLSMTATLNPAAPQTGDNTLAIMVAGPDGKPVTGLKLTTSVAMTSMDMGTTHPAFTETGSGRYTAKVKFSMDGPWRVVVHNQGGKFAVLDFNAGSKTPWKSPQIKAAGVAPTPPALPAAPAATTMSGMDMGDGKSMTEKPMKMTGIGDMKTAVMPQLKETGTYIATGKEDWIKQSGFGRNAGMVGMMNQMMVGGSGMEGMKMPAMDMKFDAKTYAPPSADEADDSMAGMDMGKAADAGKPNDTSKPDTMAGMKMDAPKPSDAPAPAPAAVTATMASAPKSGDNPLTITVTDASGKPVTGAALSASVAMTSMDMGTTHPVVTEKGAGQYASTVNFSMAGPWRVKVKVTAPGQKPLIKAFDFEAK